MARKIRKHALPGDIACCHGPGIKALNCCAGIALCVETVSRLLRVIIGRSSQIVIPAHVLVRVLVLPVRILHTSSLSTYIEAMRWKL